MLKIISIALGGAAGALSRYVLGGWAHSLLNTTLPVGTFVVNILGCLVIGLLWGLLESVNISQNVRLLLFVGFLGSFTTFSSLSLETYNLIRDSEYGWAIANVSISFVVGLVMVIAGFWASRFIMALIK